MFFHLLPAGTDFILQVDTYAYTVHMRGCILCRQTRMSAVRGSVGRLSAQGEVKLWCGNENECGPWESTSIPRVIHL